MMALLAMALLQDPPPPRPPVVEEEPVFRRDAQEQLPEPRRGPGPRPPPSNVEELKAWLKEHEPETFRRFEQAVAEGRRPEGMRLLAEAEPRMRETRELMARDPKAWERMQEMRGLERETMEMAERIRGAQPADREAGGKLLREKLSRLFDLREEAKAREVEELRRRIAEIERQLEVRKSAKPRIVDRRARELLGERLPDEW